MVVLGYEVLDELPYRRILGDLKLEVRFPEAVIVPQQELGVV
jgi:hypothetical protein